MPREAPVMTVTGSGVDGVMNISRLRLQVVDGVGPSGRRVLACLWLHRPAGPGTDASRRHSTARIRR